MVEPADVDQEEGPTRVCTGCGRSVWLERCCPGHEIVIPVVHLRRESSVRPGAFRIICGASLREEWHISDAAAGTVNCPSCRAILDREAASRS